MRIKEIIKLVEAKLKELEREELRKGTDITSPDFKNVLSKLKEAELATYGISMAEYNRITAVKKKEKAEIDKGEKGEKGDSIKGESGKDGKDGRDGIDGKTGKEGKPGRDGIDGKDGKQGEMGIGIQGIKGNKGDTPDIKKERKALMKYIDKQVGSQLIGTFKGRVSDKGGRFYNWGMPDKGSYGIAIADSRYYKKELIYTKTEADTRYVNTAGDTMTGLLTLSGAPTSDLHASTKKYVDDSVGAENLWDRSDSTLTPHTANDSIDLGSGDIAAANISVAAGSKLNIEGSAGDTYLIYSGGTLKLYVDNVLQCEWE